MPNGYSNPYISEYDAWMQTIDPTHGATWEGQIPSLYSYSGLSPDIMRAIEGAFAFDMSPTEGWGTDFNIAGLTEEDVSGGWASDWLGDQSLNVATPDIFEGSLEANIYGYDPETQTQGDLLWAQGELTQGSPFVNVFDEASIAQGLSLVGGLGLDPIRASEVKAITEGQVERAGDVYYDPYEKSKRGEIIDKVAAKRGKISPAGFAGSGAYTGADIGVKDFYSGAIGDVLADILKMRGEATEDVLGTISGWKELLASQQV